MTGDSCSSQWNWSIFGFNIDVAPNGKLPFFRIHGDQKVIIAARTSVRDPDDALRRRDSLERLLGVLVLVLEGGCAQEAADDSRG
jgi:hypothetical protein